MLNNPRWWHKNSGVPTVAMKRRPVKFRVVLVGEKNRSFSKSYLIVTRKCSGFIGLIILRFKFGRLTKIRTPLPYQSRIKSVSEKEYGNKENNEDFHAVYKVGSLAVRKMSKERYFKTLFPLVGRRR